jgi:hypothetical protein
LFSLAAVNTVERLMRPTASLRLLALALAGGAISACSSDPWLQESNPSGNLFYDPRLAAETRTFWYVPASQVSVAAELLKTRAFVAISPERAAPLIGYVPDVPTGESLYLIRAVDVENPKPLRVYQLGTWVQVHAGKASTCFIFPPPIRRQPIVVALPRTPTRLRLTYSCGD